MKPPCRSLAHRFYQPAPIPLRKLLKLSALLAAMVIPAGTIRGEDPLPDVDRLRSSPVLQHLRPNPVPRPGSTGPQRTVAEMHVPEGFRVDVVLGEPDLHQPVAFAWDERGRIWVAEA